MENFVSLVELEIEFGVARSTINRWCQKLNIKKHRTRCSNIAYIRLEDREKLIPKEVKKCQ